jgi:hypothetical protein
MYHSFLSLKHVKWGNISKRYKIAKYSLTEVIGLINMSVYTNIALDVRMT